MKIRRFSNFAFCILDDAYDVSINFDSRKGIIKIKKIYDGGTNHYTLHNLCKKTKKELKQLLLNTINDIKELQYKIKQCYGKTLSRLTKYEMISVLYRLYGKISNDNFLKFHFSKY